MLLWTLTSVCVCVFSVWILGDGPIDCEPVDILANTRMVVVLFVYITMHALCLVESSVDNALVQSKRARTCQILAA